MTSLRRFYYEKQPNDKNLIIQGEEHHHLKNVIKIRNGEKIELINGKGHLFLGEVRQIDKDESLIKIIKTRQEKKPSLKIVLSPAILKKRAMDLMIEKLTEIGIDEIRPVIFQRTDVKYNKSMLLRWKRIALQSLKVNKNLWLTKIYPPVNISEIINFSKEINNKILLDVNGEKTLGVDLDFPIITVLGPAGDLMANERELFLDNGFIPCNINNQVLKSETAAISIAAILKQQYDGQA